MKRIIPALALSLLTAACTHVDAGNVGVEVNSCSGGGVNPNPVGVGYHATGPCTNIVEFPVFQQTMLQEGDQTLHVTSSEGLPISVDVSLSFTVENAKAPHIYEKFRKELADIEALYIRQALREALQETFAKYTAQQLYSDKKETARGEVQGLLTRKLILDGFAVTQFTINKTGVPGEVLNAINSKVAMTQQAQQAEQQVKKVEFEAAQATARAKGAADSMRMAADAEAYSNRKITESLSPVLVRYKLAGRWDGKLPQVEGTGGNLLFSLKD